MLKKIISSGGRILGIIESIIEYDISIVSDTALRARTEMITEGPDSNLIIIFKDRVSSSELSDVPEDFKNITVKDDDVKESQSKKRKRNKCYCTEDIIHGF